MSAGSFCYATLAPESLKQHKLEMAVRHPDFRFAFSRPGLVTWKAPEALGEDFRPAVAIALSSGVSVGSFATLDLALERLARDASAARVLVHYRPRAEGAPAPDGERLASIAEALESAGHRAPNGAESVVYDLVVPESAEEPLFLGRRRVRRYDPRDRAHFDRVVPPPESPSRAYAKLAEALARLGNAKPKSGAVIELGAAPGGAVLRLLEEGFDVTAVDPAELATTLSSLAEAKGRRLVHLQKPAGELNREELPSRFELLVCDMNLAPQVVLPLVRKTLNLSRGTKRVLLTLKLNDDKAVAALPRIEGDLRRDFPDLELVKLPSHRTEVVAIGTR